MGLIYLTRHGETELNLLDCFQGAYDGPETKLTEKGISQAISIAERLKDVHIDKIYSSPLKRAIETANYINKYHNLDIIIEKDLCERYLGSWEGRKHKEVKEELNISDQEWANNRDTFTPIDGESQKDFNKRITDIFLKIANENKDKDILIVDHVLAIQVISSIVKHQEFNPSIFVAQASLTIIENNEDFKVLLDGDTSHIK